MNDGTLSYWADMYSKPNVFGTGPTKLALLGYSLIKNSPIKNILEIGCGQGRDAIFFSKNGYDVKTFDISKDAISFVNKTKDSLKLKNLNAIVHDVKESFPYEKNSFDFVYSNLALQFFDIHSLEIIFENIHSVMKNDTSLLFSTKKKGDKYYNFGTRITDNAFNSKGIIRYFYDKPDLEELLTKKFSIEKFDDDLHQNPDMTTSVWWKILLRKK